MQIFTCFYHCIKQNIQTTVCNHKDYYTSVSVSCHCFLLLISGCGRFYNRFYDSVEKFPFLVRHFMYSLVVEVFRVTIIFSGILDAFTCSPRNVIKNKFVEDKGKRTKMGWSSIVFYSTRSSPLIHCCCQ